MFLQQPLSINKSYFKVGFAGLLVLMLLLPLSVSTKKLYMWYDENGNPYFSDKVPPKENEKARTELNKKGRKVDEIGRAKTPEEIAKEKELERLRKEREAIIAKQQAQDAILLKTFRSEEDLVMARDGKIASLDNYINITKGNIKRFKSKLSGLQAEAAQAEKAGKTVGQGLQEEMDSIKRQITKSYSSIITREQNKEVIRQDYNNDIRRFRTLKKLSASDDLDQEEKERAELNTVYICEDVNTCNLVWEKAKEYVENNATTKLQLTGEGIHMTRGPKEDNDISLTVARIIDKNTQEERIFLDQQCRTSSTKGIEFCKSEASLKIKRNFLPYLLK